MLISKISNNYSNSFYKQNKINFKGNSSRPTPESMQNNDPEIHISPELYYGAMIDKASKDTTEEDIDKMSELFENGSDEDVIRTITASSIDTLQTVVKAEYDAIPPDKLKKIPFFVQYNVEDYLRTFDSLNEQMAEFTNALQENASIIDADEEGADEAMFLAEIMSEGVSSMPDFSMQGKILREEKYGELQEIFNMMNKANNYSYLEALEAGLQRNSKRVIDIITKGSFAASEPQITDNGNGTSTYLYPAFGSVLEITRDNSNGDYINFAAGYAKEMKGEFNADGTIKSLTIQSPYDINTCTKIIPDSKYKIVRTINTTSDMEAIRDYKRNSDGTYSLINMQIKQK